MKKVFVLSVLILGLFSITDMSVKAAQAPKPEKIEQVLMSLKCCDGTGTVRCILGAYTPVGNACYCYGQGWGYTC